MAGAAVRYVGDAGLQVEGFGRFVPTDHGLAAPLSSVEQASLSSLKRALSRWLYNQSPLSEHVWFVDADAAEVGENPDYWLRAPVELQYWDIPEDKALDGLSILVTTPLPEGSAPEQTIRRISAPLMERRKAVVTSVAIDADDGYEVAYVSIRFSSLRGRKVSDAYRLGNDLFELVVATLSGSLTRETALDLLRAGQADLLVGQAECQWLECKRAPYRLSEERQCFELAKDVAALANTETGGVIVIGAEARKDSDGKEIVRSIRPFPADTARPTAYRSKLRNRIYPPVDAVEIFRVSPPGRDATDALLILSIPPQDRALKPFLVRGAVIGGRLNDSYITLVTRHGDEIQATDIAVIHSLLAIGRAAVSGSLGSVGHSTASTRSASGGVSR